MLAVYLRLLYKMINFHPSQGFIYIFEEGAGFKDTYKLSMAYVMLSDTTIYIQSFQGKLSKKNAEELKEELRFKGIDKIIAWFPTKWKSIGFKPLPNTNLHYLDL